MSMIFNFWFLGIVIIIMVVRRMLGRVGVIIGPLFFRVIADHWSIRFFGLLIIISSRVMRWSYYYMSGEENYVRFILIIILFVVRIVILIFFGTLVGALIGWDGLGVTSFLLVIYYKNRKSLGSGIITALSNRLGDCFFLLILGLFFIESEHFYRKVFLLLMASITKSAQIPFSSWLPSAMAAPTPVRALVHSSTLVTAGVYLLLRFNDFTTEWIGFVGGITILIAGVCACVEIDIKKIVALSTLSQLGVIIVSLSTFQKNICFFHLVTHAIFKALLFICVGIAIHTIYGSQDFRSFNNIGKNILHPINILLMANIALMGFPFMAGFYRKDIIIEYFYSSYSCFMGGVFFLVGIGLTAAYRVKIINLACVGNNRRIPIEIIYGGLSWQVKVPLTVLGLSSIFRGFVVDRFLLTSVVILKLDKLIPLICVVVGLIVGILLTNYKNKNFSSILIISPIAQKIRHIPVSGEKDSGFIETFGGSGIIESLKNFYFTFHPLLAISLLVVFWGF